MRDEEVEAQLRQYRPAGPPAGLRGRIVGGFQSQPVRRWLQWCPAAAAAVVVALFSMLAADSRASLAAVSSHGAQERERRVAELSALLGGGALAQIEAERIVDRAYRDEMR